MKKWSIRLLAAVVWVASPGVQAQNLLVNGNFENPAANSGNGAVFYSGWSEYWNFGTAGEDGVNRDGANRQNWGTEVGIPFQGAVSAKNFFDGGILQQVSILGGEQYVLSGATYVPAGGSVLTDQWGTFASVRWLQADGVTVLDEFFDLRHDNEPRGQWNTFSDLLTAPAGASFGRIQIGTYSNNPIPGPGQIVPASPTLFDDISFAAIPEPGTFGLLAAGFGAMYWAVRRRRGSIIP
jgi:hypothetical protein